MTRRYDGARRKALREHICVDCRGTFLAAQRNSLRCDACAAARIREQQARYRAARRARRAAE